MKIKAPTTVPAMAPREVLVPLPDDSVAVAILLVSLADDSVGSAVTDGEELLMQEESSDIPTVFTSELPP